MALLISGQDVPRLRSMQSVQPSGVFGRRHIPLDMKQKLCTKASEARKAGSISDSYLLTQKYVGLGFRV